MNRQALLAHRDRLLRAGVPYRQVRRQLVELQDHHAELCREGLRRGLDESAAAAWAAQQLGSLQEIAARTLANGGRRSFWVRYPRLMLLLPILLYAGGVMSVFCLMVATLALLAPFGTGAIPPGWLEPIFRGLRLFVLHGLTPLLSLLLVRQQLRYHQAPGYWMAGVLLLCLLGSATSITLIWPDPLTQTQGVLGGSVGPSWHYGNSVRLLFNLLLSGGVGWYWQRRRRSLLLD
ncbi:MAG TPA: hypothetical protein VNR18_12700 [Hyphomicrobiales bacterium]|nr:hypothetical protein [Hyphomicrobiales bacterium]